MKKTNNNFLPHPLSNLLQAHLPGKPYESPPLIPLESHQKKSQIKLLTPEIKIARSISPIPNTKSAAGGSFFISTAYLSSALNRFVSVIRAGTPPTYYYAASIAHSMHTRTILYSNQFKLSFFIAEAALMIF